MFFNGQTLICIQDFSIFRKGEKYYCTHTSDGHFFINNNFTNYNVATIKVSFKLAKIFKVKNGS